MVVYRLHAVNQCIEMVMQHVNSFVTQVRHQAHTCKGVKFAFLSLTEKAVTRSKPGALSVLAGNFKPRPPVLAWEFAGKTPWARARRDFPPSRGVSTSSVGTDFASAAHCTLQVLGQSD